MSILSVQARTDGFGAQIQHYMWAAYYAESHNARFVMPIVEHIEHNYDKKPDWVSSLVDLMKLNDLFESNTSTLSSDVGLIPQTTYCNFVEANIDNFLESETMRKIRERFFSENDHLLDKYCIRKKEMLDAVNIAVHIRRNNSDDCRVVDPATTSFDIFRTEIDKLLLETPNDRNVRIHIVSQASFGEIRDGFFDYLRSGENGRKVTVAIHPSEDVIGPFLTMATADYLITSPSSFSYAAALLNKGTVIYYPFWHNPSKYWRLMNVPKQNLLGYNC